MRVFCECVDEDCLASAELPDAVFDWALREEVYVIADTCLVGPEPGARLVQRGPAYGLWRPAAGARRGLTYEP